MPTWRDLLARLEPVASLQIAARLPGAGALPLIAAARAAGQRLRQEDELQRRLAETEIALREAQRNQIAAATDRLRALLPWEVEGIKLSVQEMQELLPLKIRQAEAAARAEEANAYIAQINAQYAQPLAEASLRTAQANANAAAAQAKEANFKADMTIRLGEQLLANYPKAQEELSRLAANVKEYGNLWAQAQSKQAELMELMSRWALQGDPQLAQQAEERIKQLSQEIVDLAVRLGNLRASIHMQIHTFRAQFADVIQNFPAFEQSLQDMQVQVEKMPMEILMQTISGVKAMAPYFPKIQQALKQSKSIIQDLVKSPQKALQNMSLLFGLATMFEPLNIALGFAYQNPQLISAGIDNLGRTAMGFAGFIQDFVRSNIGYQQQLGEIFARAAARKDMIGAEEASALRQAAARTQLDIWKMREKERIRTEAEMSRKDIGRILGRQEQGRQAGGISLPSLASPQPPAIVQEKMYVASPDEVEIFRLAPPDVRQKTLEQWRNNNPLGARAVLYNWYNWWQSQQKRKQSRGGGGRSPTGRDSGTPQGKGRGNKPQNPEAEATKFAGVNRRSERKREEARKKSPFINPLGLGLGGW